MAFQEALFRNSLWSRDDSRITVHSISELDSPEEVAGNQRLRRALNTVSKFSIDSDDESDYNDYPSSQPKSSPLSNLSRHTERYARRARSRSHLQMSWMRGVRSHDEHHVTPLSVSQPITKFRDTPVAPEESGPQSLQKSLTIIIICVVHLCARKLLCIENSGHQSIRRLIQEQKQVLAKHSQY
jgi:hypothetical protein